MLFQSQLILGLQDLLERLVLGRVVLARGSRDVVVDHTAAGEVERVLLVEPGPVAILPQLVLLLLEQPPLLRGQPLVGVHRKVV